MTICPHCGLMHETTCPRIRSVEYHENGTIKRIEFHAPQPVSAAPMQAPSSHRPHWQHVVVHRGWTHPDSIDYIPSRWNEG